VQTPPSLVLVQVGGAAAFSGGDETGALLVEVGLFGRK